MEHPEGKPVSSGSLGGAAQPLSDSQLMFEKRQLAKPMLGWPDGCLFGQALMPVVPLSPTSLPAEESLSPFVGAPRDAAPPAALPQGQNVSLLSAAISAHDAERRKATPGLLLQCSGSILRKSCHTPSPTRRCTFGDEPRASHTRFCAPPLPLERPRNSRTSSGCNNPAGTAPCQPQLPTADILTRDNRRPLTFLDAADLLRSRAERLSKDADAAGHAATRHHFAPALARSQSESSHSLVSAASLAPDCGQQHLRRASASLLPQPSLALTAPYIAPCPPAPLRTRTLQFAENPDDPIEWHERERPQSRASRRSTSTGSGETHADAIEGALAEADAPACAEDQAHSPDDDDEDVSSESTDSDYQAQQESESDDEEDDRRIGWSSRADWIDAGPALLRKARSLPASPGRQSYTRIAISSFLPDAFEDSATSSNVSSYSGTTAATTISLGSRAARSSADLSPVKSQRAFSIASKPSTAASTLQVMTTLSLRPGETCSSASSLLSSPTAPPDIAMFGEPRSDADVGTGSRAAPHSSREDALRLLRSCLCSSQLYRRSAEQTDTRPPLRVVSAPHTPRLSKDFS